MIIEIPMVSWCLLVVLYILLYIEMKLDCRRPLRTIKVYQNKFGVLIIDGGGKKVDLPYKPICKPTIINFKFNEQWRKKTTLLPRKPTRQEK